MKNALLINALAAVLIFTACVTRDAPDTVVNRVNVGDRVPSFNVSGPGGAFDSPAGFSGKTSVLLLFNTGCPDCSREMPKVYSLWQKIKDDSTCQVVAIAREQTAEEVARDWKYGEMKYYIDKDRSVFNKFANMTIPRIYIIDKSGAVRWMAVEYLLDGNGSEMTAGQFEKLFMDYVK